MSLPEIMIIAVGLAMDSFAVSITLGLSVQKPKLVEYLIPGIYFGLFHVFMPLIGYFAGTYFAAKIQHLDHWIAFALLGFVGGKMIKESFSKDDDESSSAPSFNFVKMLLLSVATSIDILAVGVTFAFFTLNIVVAVLITGFTTFSFSIAGVKIGNLFGNRYKAKATCAGGIVLVLLGVKILIEGLFFT